MVISGSHLDFFNAAPREIILTIFSHLNPGDLLTCAAVSRRFSSCANEEALWQAMSVKEVIPLSFTQDTAKAKVNAYCLKFTQLFKAIFPNLSLPSNRYQQYEMLKAMVTAQQAQQGEFQTQIQAKLDSHLAENTISFETVTLLVQAGAKISEGSIYHLIKKIKEYSNNDNAALQQRYRFTSRVVTSESTQSFKESLKVLGLFLRAGGRIGHTDDPQRLTRIALKYQCYELAKLLLRLHVPNRLRSDSSLNEFLSSILDVKPPDALEDLLHIKEMIEILLKAGAQSPGNFNEALQKLRIDPQSLDIVEHKRQRTPESE